MMISALKMIADRIALCGRGEPHDVERLQLRVEGHEHRRDDGEVLGHVVGDRERGQRAARHQELLADLDDLDELGRVGVEVDHVAGLARRHRAGVHGDADIGLRQRRRVVGAVAAHGDELALGLLVADELRACPPASPGRGSRRRPASAAMAAAVIGLSPVIMTVRMPMRRSSAKRSRMPPLTMSLRWMTPSSRPSRATASGVPPALAISSAMAWISRTASALTPGCRTCTAPVAARLRRCGHGGEDRVDRALADRGAVEVDAAHAGLRRERHEVGAAGSAISRARMPYFSLASTTIERPSGVSSASEASWAASASSCSRRRRARAGTPSPAGCRA